MSLLSLLETTNCLYNMIMLTIFSDSMNIFYTGKKKTKKNPLSYFWLLDRKSWKPLEVSKVFLL